MAASSCLNRGASQVNAWFESWNAVASAAELVLVLPEGALLRPTGVVLLAAGIADRQRLGLKTSLRAASGDSDAYRCLQRIDFFTALGIGTAERSTRPDAADRSIPLRRITDERTAHALAEATIECLRAQLPELPSSPLRMAGFVFEELGVNVVQHSGAAETGFGVLQSLASEIEIAFADRGVGFLASLQRNPEFAGRIDSEAEALQIAVGKGVTGSLAPWRSMGIGLGLLQDFADRIDGELWIASGSATLRRRTVAGIRTMTTLAKAPWRGSWIGLVAPLGAR